MRFYYKDEDETFFMYDTETDKLKETDKNVVCERGFKMMDGYDKTKKGIKRYVEDFNQWCDEIESVPIKLGHEIHKTDKDTYYKGDAKTMNFDPRRYRTMQNIVVNVFKRFCRKDVYDYESISYIERQYMNDCYNSGLLYCDPQDDFIQTYSYDFNNHYAKCMTSDKLLIPTKQGKQIKLSCLPKINEIQLGYYRVNISCDNDDFKKIFSFSKKNTYDDKALYQAMKYKDTYNVKIELNTTLKYNAYVYDEDNVVTGKKLFLRWFDWLSEIKTKYQCNRLVKCMLSQLHGYLSEEKKSDWLTREQIEKKYDCSKIGIDPEKSRYIETDTKFFGDVEKIRIIDTHKDDSKYGFNIRIKAFLTSFCRNKMSRLICNNLDDVVRVCIDSVALKKDDPKIKANKELKYELKSSGKILWISAGQYVKRLDDGSLDFHGNISKQTIELIHKDFS